MRAIFGERALSLSGPKALNALPGSFHSVESPDPLKKQLKLYHVITLFSR